jgi:RNA polymerase sigma-70 factor (ECF subfamily)
MSGLSGWRASQLATLTKDGALMGGAPSRAASDASTRRDGSDRSDGEDERAETRLVSRAITAAQAGDRAALGFLYARYSENVCGYVRSILHDQHDAEDVTQQVFAKLIRSICKYEEREVPFLAWILRVARNAAIDHVRGQRLIPVEEVRVTDNGAANPRAPGRKMDDLAEALSTLPEDQREVLVLRHFAGFSPTEIATQMERSEGSIHGLHHRGRRALQAELSRRGAAPSTSRGPRA